MKEPDPLDEGPTNLVVLRSGPGDATVLVRPSQARVARPMDATVAQPEPESYELPSYLQPEPAVDKKEAKLAERRQRLAARQNAEAAALFKHQNAATNRLAAKHHAETQRLALKHAREARKLEPPRRFARASEPPPSAASVRNRRFVLAVALVVLALSVFASALYAVRTEPLAIEYVGTPFVRFMLAGSWNWIAIAAGFVGVALLAWVCVRKRTPLAVRFVGVTVCGVALAVLVAPLLALVE